VLAVAAVAATAAVHADEALAAPWCGTPTTEDRPPAITGRSIRVVYAYPSDAPDRSAERAGLISSDVDEVAAWWRGQDAEREPRFDRVGFACGLQVDLIVVKLPNNAGSLLGDRFDLVADAVLAATGPSQYEKHLVYFDGPVDNPEICGQGGGTADGAGVAIVYLAACTGIPTATVVAHELIHALGAMADSGPPHACPDTRAHPCDSASDILYPEASEAALGALVLDVGRDDYYGHSGAWLDTQDSRWLWLVTRQVSLTTSIAGKGSVESDIPGLDCAAGCVTQWDTGSSISLEALAGEGQRFVRWSGACSGSGICEVTLATAQTVTALFAPERFGLVISLAGKGSVAGAGAACRVPRCQRSVTSYTPLHLRAKPTAGWRFAGWGGACKGVGVTCTIPMTKATAVRARFVKR
jgi:Divergent InlB B-repeat domain